MNDVLPKKKQREIVAKIKIFFDLNWFFKVLAATYKPHVESSLLSTQNGKRQ